MFVIRVVLSQPRTFFQLTHVNANMCQLTHVSAYMCRLTHVIDIIFFYSSRMILDFVTHVGMCQLTHVSVNMCQLTHVSVNMCQLKKRTRLQQHDSNNEHTLSCTCPSWLAARATLTLEPGYIDFGNPGSPVGSSPPLNLFEEVVIAAHLAMYVTISTVYLGVNSGEEILTTESHRLC